MKFYPETYQQGDFVFLLHIPKTAGTSLTQALQTGFPKNRVITPQQMNSARKQTKNTLNNAELLCGHFTLLMCERRLPKQPDLVLTFLRDPIQHFVSLFFHLKIDPTFAYTIRLTKNKEAAQDLHSRIKDLKIEEFLKMEESELFDNFQTRYLINGLCAEYSPLSDVQKLPIVQKSLLELPFFGLTDRYEDSLKLLGHVMENSVKLRTSKVNRSRNKPRNFALAAETINTIEERTVIDRRLFQFAQQVFGARLDALPVPD